MPRASGDTPGRLFIVSTPIGNMGDFSFRGVETLRSVALVLAEDTRHSRRLLERHEIATPMQAYHEHNEAQQTSRALQRLAAGDDLALVSDAGTPLISDPGARLVQAAIAAGIAVVPVPGASAVLAALVASGLPAQPFTFVGFLARSGAERTQQIAMVLESRVTVVLYEAPNRVAGTLKLLAEPDGVREAAVARELTKVHEDVRRGTLAELAAYYEETPPKGEVVIVIDGAPERAVDAAGLDTRARELRTQGTSARDTTTLLVREFGVARNVAYRVAREAGP